MCMCCMRNDSIAHLTHSANFNEGIEVQDQSYHLMFIWNIFQLNAPINNFSEFYRTPVRVCGIFFSLACILNQQKHQPYFHRIPALKCTTKNAKTFTHIANNSNSDDDNGALFSNFTAKTLSCRLLHSISLRHIHRRSWSFVGSEWMSACSCMRCFWFSFMCVRFNWIAGWAYSLILMYGYCGMYGSMVLHTHRYWVCSWPGMWYGCHLVHHKDCQYICI